MTAAPDAGRDSWDLFCRVVDNFGDIGIAWRLARQLAADPRRDVRLFVDGLEAFARIDARVEARAARDRSRQTLDRIEIVEWCDEEMAFDGPASVVVELLGCGLPLRYLDAMTRAGERDPATATVWIDFEHLSAEAWVDEYHGLPSPHPARPLTKHFYYPGFGARTGGLLIEPGLAERRAAFVADPRAVESLWRALGLSPPIEREKRLSLFVYDDAPVDALIDTLSRSIERSWSIVVPDGVASAAIERFIGRHGRTRTRDALTVTSVPFVDQDTYDRLLWACDVNFVRGEDSFVRAQAAGRPSVWQPYRQAGSTHLKKLQAFEERYEADLPTGTAAAQRALSVAWNDPAVDARPALQRWFAKQATLREHAERWRSRCAEAPLIDRLLAFVDARRQPSPRSDLLD